MKKLGIIKITLAVLLCLTLFLALFSCKKGDDAIKIEKLPLRTVYYVGEAPTLDGMILSVKTENGRESIEATDDMLSESSKLMFTKRGDATVTVEYNGLSLSFVVFVDDDIAAHKTFALSYLSVWAEDEAVLDEVTLSCIERAKQLISESDSHEKIAEHLENAKDYAYTYSEGIRYKEKLDAAKNEAKSTLLSFDFSAYTLDYAKKIADLISDALSDVETAGTLEEVETTLNSLRKEADEMKSDERNKRVFAFEAEFKTVYENKAALFPESEYEDLLLKLIDAEEKIREAATDEAAEMLSKDFFEKAESTFLTYPELIYKKISALKRDELIFGEDKKSLDELACDIFTFAKNLDGESFGGSEYNKIEDLLALNKDESFKSLSSYAALSKYETKIKTYNLIEEAILLYEDYELLIQAADEAKAVISSINAIGRVTLDSTEKIDAARLAYKKWSEKFSINEESKNAFIIENYDKLKKAEADIKTLPAKAKAAADEVRAVIKALLEKDVIYSDTSKGVGDDVEKAKKAYQGWIDTYGSVIDSYINDGTNYKIKLDSYSNEYEQIKKKAEDIIAKVSELRAKLGALTYDNYATVSAQIDSQYKSLSSLYTDFENTNGKVVDKVSVFLSLEGEILFARVKAYEKHYLAEIQKASDDYAAKINTAYEFSSHRSALKTLTAELKENIEYQFDEDKSLEQNLKNLLSEYEDGLDELKKLYTAYLFDYEVYSANQRLSELSNSYTDASFLEKRDEIINKAKNDVSALSKATTIEKYSEAIANIIKKAEENLKSAYKAS